MKHKFTPLLVVSAIVLMSMSECKNPLDHIIKVPISAEVDGVEYYSEGYTILEHHVSAASYSEFTDLKGERGFEFSLHRTLYSENNESILISPILISYEDSLKIDKIYPCRFLTENRDFADGSIYFSEKSENRLVGTFEFDVKDPETHEIMRSVKNGKFDVLYH